MRGRKVRNGMPPGRQTGSTNPAIMRDALRVVLHEEVEVKIGKRRETFKKMRVVASKLVDEAMTGNVPAIKEVFERMDGKVKQVVGHEGAEGGELITGEIRLVLVEAAKKARKK